MIKQHVDEFFGDLEESHPENFFHEVPIFLKTQRKLTTADIHELGKFENKLKRREVLAAWMASEFGVFGLYLLFMGTLLYLAF